MSEAIPELDMNKWYLDDGGLIGPFHLLSRALSLLDKFGSPRFDSELVKMSVSQLLPPWSYFPG